MEWYIIIAVIGVGFLAGFINTLAGSGSLLTLPLLMFLGLPANVANGTNRIAILLQNIVGITSFKQQGVLSFKEGLTIGIPAAAGSLVGAQIAINLNDEIMSRTSGGLLIFMLIIIILKPDRWRFTGGKMVSDHHFLCYRDIWRIHPGWRGIFPAGRTGSRYRA